MPREETHLPSPILFPDVAEVPEACCQNQDRSTGKVFSQPLETCVFFTRFTHVLPGFAHSPSPDLKSPRSEVMHGLRAQTELSLNCGPNRVLTI